MDINLGKFKEILRESINKALFDNGNFDGVFDLSSIPYAELKNQYINYSDENDLFGDRFFTEETEEGLLVRKAKNEMTRIYGFKDWQIKIGRGAYGIEFILLFPDIFKNTKLIIEDMKKLGFFPSITKRKIYKLMCWKMIKFEPYTQKDITTQAKRYGVLYHLTPESRVESILTVGLLPKSENKSFSYSPRVHVLSGNLDFRNASIMAKKLSEANGVKEDYVLLSIDVNKLPKGINFFGDINYPIGYWTEQSIPPSAISVCTKIQL
jgi:hypothetical protein